MKCLDGMMMQFHPHSTPVHALGTSRVQNFLMFHCKQALIGSRAQFTKPVTHWWLEVEVCLGEGN